MAVMWRFTAIFWLYRLRQSRYRQKTKNRLPPKKYRRMALPRKHYRHTSVLPPPLKSLPPKSEKPPTAKQLPPYGITAQNVPPCLNGQKGWHCASYYSRYPTTGVQTHAETLFFRQFSISFVLCSSGFLVLSDSFSVAPLVEMDVPLFTVTLASSKMRNAVRWSKLREDTGIQK